jgi:nucleotide-binding universal stress UspA family protein
MTESPQRPYRIVVGFDGSEGSRLALAWGADEARWRQAQLEVVRAWSPGEFGTDEEQGQLAQKGLDEDVRAFFAESRPTNLVTHAEPGHAGKVLMKHGQEADMLVVGSRGLGGFTGLLLGSVGHQVSTHEGAPVVVIVRS